MNDKCRVSEMMYEYMCTQEFPISSSALKTTFFNMCRPPLSHKDCLDHLVAVGSLVRRMMTVKTEEGQELTDEVVATPNVMARFENATQKTS